MNSLFAVFKRHPKKDRAPDPTMQALLRSVSMTDEQEISCEEVYALMDQYAEMVKRGEDASRLMPMVQKHLNMCPDCREEYEALLKMMEVPAKDEDRRS